MGMPLARAEVSASEGVAMQKTGHVHWTHVVAAAGAGALLMYLLDPQHGRSRRASLSRERLGELARSGREVAETRARDVRHRLGELKDAARELPARQRDRLRHGMQAAQETWAPRSRVLAMSASTGLAFYGAARRSLPGTLLGLAGIGLALRAGANRDVARMIGRAGAARTVDIQKSIHIGADRERVYELWTRYENFPHFMSLVKEVRPLGENRSHWVVQGPAGTTVEWDSVVTERIAPQWLAWRSEHGSPVQHEGSVRFDEENGGTRVIVRLSYVPPGGALGHRVATLLGRDPKRHLDADLMRMKTYAETGVPPRDAAQRESFAAVRETHGSTRPS
jgi:uncharacterized membrane protein